MKKILLIGDLSMANNWGAIGTSETLIHQIKSIVGESEITTIDYRSFVSNTPAEGWGKLNIKDAWQRFDLMMDWVPHSFNDFNRICIDILEGKKFQYEYEMIKNHEIVVINGEGNIVNKRKTENYYRRGARYILLIAYFTKKYLQKPCVIINHTVDPDNTDAEEMIRNIYPLLDFIAVREPLSIDELHKIVGTQLDVKFAPDALFGVDINKNMYVNKEITKQIDFSQPYICIGDSSGLPYVNWDIYFIYKTLIRHLRKICRQIVIINGNSAVTNVLRQVARVCDCGWISTDNCEYKELITIFNKALIYISGRWHPSILSLLAGTPILLWGADSHKTKGLTKLINYEYGFYNLDSIPGNIYNIVNDAKSILAKRDQISLDIKEKVDQLVNRSMDNLRFIQPDSPYFIRKEGLLKNTNGQ